jgi:hypothetical protein
MWRGSVRSTGKRSEIVSARNLRRPSLATRGIQLAAWLFFRPGVEPNSIRLVTRSGIVMASCWPI